MSYLDAIGVVSNALWGKETTYGVPATTIENQFMALQSVSFKTRDELFKKRMLAGGQDVQGSYLGAHEVSLSIESFLTTRGELWELILGGTPSDDGTGLMTVVPEDTLPSFTTRVGYKEYASNWKAFDIVGCKVNSAELSISKGDLPVKLRLDVIGQKETNSSTFPSLLDPPPQDIYTHVDASIDFGSGLAEAGIQELTLGINRNVDKKTSIGSRFVRGLYEKTREYTLNMKLYFKEEIYNNFWGDTSGPVAGATKDPSFVDLVITLQRDADNYTNIYLREVYLEEVESPINIEDLVVTTVSGYASSLTKIEYKHL